jgi:hypothetical protein
VIRYCCDRCKREIDSRFELRYSLTIEIEAAIEDGTEEVVDDPDHLDELQQLLDSSDELCSSPFGDEVYQRKQFDLCKECFCQYIKNPLAKEPTGNSIGFSKN